MKQTNTPQKMRVVFFFSGGASSMKAVFESPEHGELYKVVGAVTNRPEEKAERGWAVAREHEIEPVYFDPNKYEKRPPFYEAITEAIEELEPNIIGLSGFLGKYSIIVDPLLSQYRNRIINVHPANLAIIAPLRNRRALDIGRDELRKIKRDAGDKKWNDVAVVIKEGWRRLYTGDDAVAMAVLFGESEVCSTIHVVEKEVDCGKILVRSEAKPVDIEYVERMLERNAFDKIAGYAHELQDAMKRDCDAPAFCKALELLASERMKVYNNYAVLDGKQILRYGGFRLGD